MFFIIGSFHLVVLIILAVREQSLDIVNAFSVLEIDRFVPSLGEGLYSFVLSYIAIGLLLYLLYIREDRKKS